MGWSGFSRSLSRDRRRERSLSRDRNHKPSRSLSRSRRYWCSFSPQGCLVWWFYLNFWTDVYLNSLHTETFSGKVFILLLDCQECFSVCLSSNSFFPSLLTAAPDLQREDRAHVGRCRLEYEPTHTYGRFIRRSSFWMCFIMHYCVPPPWLK